MDKHITHISLCTVCMNRLNHLRQTLLKNLEDNARYPSLEFVLLDYNSSDGLQEWVRDNLQSYIKSGRLVYFHAAEPQYFHRSHSRNLAFRLASGDIVCNIDADNFTGPEFSFYLNSHFNEHKNSFLTVNFHDQENINRDTYGRIACRKKDFYLIRGFDERMEGYGYEDLDFCERLKSSGIKEYFIDREEFLNSIRHDDSARIEFEKDAGQDADIFIQWISPFASRILYLFPGQRFSLGKLLDQHEGFGNPVLEGGKWIMGTWTRKPGLVNLQPESEQSQKFNEVQSGNLVDIRNETLYRITDREFIRELRMNYPIITNHQYYLNNKHSAKIQVNPDGCGRGKVVKNFMEKIYFG
ncbi:MAG TPA: glycosyltransferase [Cyclobacteriaceae bacterium]|nr:glycosyltransferase [Cyclobacteriaceae bacterium]